MIAGASEPRAVAVRYDAKANRIVVDLANGTTFAFPPGRRPAAQQRPISTHLPFQHLWRVCASQIVAPSEYFLSFQ